MTKIVALNKDLEMTVGLSSTEGFPTTMYDNLSNEYFTSTITALDKAGGAVSFTLIQGIPVEVKFIFNNINSQATSISSFQPVFNIFDINTRSTTSVTPDFRDIDF
jgi:hypothetical protein